MDSFPYPCPHGHMRESKGRAWVRELWRRHAFGRAMTLHLHTTTPRRATPQKRPGGAQSKDIHQIRSARAAGQSYRSIDLGNRRQLAPSAEPPRCSTTTTTALFSLRILSPGRLRRTACVRACAHRSERAACPPRREEDWEDTEAARPSSTSTSNCCLGRVRPAGQLYHVPQHSRREKLRFPPDPTDSSPPPGSWPPPPPFYSYASSSSSYSPHSPTLAHAPVQLVAHGMPGTASGGAQIPSQNFALSLSSASSNLFLGPAQKLLEEICDVGGRSAQLDRGSGEGLLPVDAMDAAGSVDHEMDDSDRAAAEAVTVCGAEQQWRKTRLISLMEDNCLHLKL
ncbi:hypothetical protein GUJ93_ZPchr0001g31104 [Zizania palustris]|uniref:Uncharacterized protein n=1 Tax=Zizania palustris TaxID=103762 RepID=A0A8J5R672_ZIZPA|nr:hypothetical protein GUJ93_ZPchr0001g31104 [Zizania palustris]